MSVALRILLIVVSVMNTLNILRRIRKSKLQIEYSIFWLLFSMVLIVISVFPQIVIKLAQLIGFQSPANMVFLFVIFILMLAMPSGSIIAMIVREYGGKTEEEDICSKGVLMTTLFSIITIPIVVLFL